MLFPGEEVSYLPNISSTSLIVAERRLLLQQRCLFRFDIVGSVVFGTKKVKNGRRKL